MNRPTCLLPEAPELQRVWLSESDFDMDVLFENNPHPMWVYDLETLAFLAVNEAAVRYYGYSRDEFLAMTIADIRPPEDVPALRENVAHVTEGLDHVGEWRHRRKDGSLIIAEITSHTLTFAGRRAEVVMVNDITERRRAEEALQASEARFRLLAENARDLIYRYRFAPERGFEYVSPSATTITGYTPEEHYADPDLGFKLVHPDDRHLLESLAQSPPEAGTPLTLRWVRKDGSILWTEQRNVPIYDSQGNLAAIEGIARDVTERKQAEVALREKEYLLAEAQRTGHMGSWEYDAASDRLRYSDQMYRLFGISPEAFSHTAEGFLSLIHPDDKAAMVAWIENTLAGRKPGESDFRIVLPDQTIRYIHGRGEASFDRTGRLLRATGTAQDVTEARQALGALRAKTKELDRYFNDSLDLLCIADTDGYFHRLNPEWEKTLGYTLPELEGQRFMDFVHPDDQAATRQAVAQLADQQEVLNFVNRYRRKDGAYRWIEWRSYPAGEMIYAVARDITERTQAEAALHDSEDRYRDLVEHSQDLICTHDLQGFIRSANPAAARLLGYGLDELLRMNIRDVLAPEALGGFELYLRRMRKRGAVSGEMVVRTRAGERRVWEYNNSLRTEGVNEPLVRGMARDVTERKQAEAAEREQRALAEALSDAATTLNSTLDFDEVLDRLLENTGRVVPNDIADIMLIDPQTGVARIARGRGYAEHGLEPALTTQFRVADFANLRQMAKTGQPIVIPDTRTDPGWVQMPDTRWIRSYVGAPIVVQGQVIGFVNLDSPTPGFFAPLHAARLQAFADHTAVAVHNARLFDETRRRLSELEAVARISAALRSAQSLDEMLPILLDETLAVLRTEAGSVVLYDPASAELRPVARRGWLAAVDQTPLKPGEGIAGHVFNTGAAHVSREFASDPRARESSRPQIPAGWGGACVPIRTSQEVVGMLSISVPAPRALTEDEIRLLTTLAEIAGNAIHRARLHEQTEKRLQQVQALRAIDMAITASFDVRLTLDIVLAQAVAQLGVDAAAVLLLAPDTQQLECVAARGFRTDAIQRLRLRPGEGLAGRAALERNLISVPNLPASRAEFARAGLLAGEGFAAYFAAPLIVKGQVRGVLELFHRSPLQPDADWLEFLEALTGQAAIAVDNASLFDNLQRANADLTLAYDATIEGWSRALDLRDEETEGHTRRVTEMTLRLAQAMGLSDAELVHIRRGALLHDIGKMGVPDGILHKPGPLTEEEWAAMKKHPQYAYDMLKPITYLRPALAIPYSHHEKWDGTGYPRGLKGEQIPLAARIFAMVDVWDALRSDRPYRPAWPEEKVREHIRSLAGTHFDPQVVEAFLKVLPQPQ